MTKLSIYRSKHTQEYVVLPNNVAQDGSLSMKASGLLHYMLSLPADWKFNVQHLANHFKHDGKAAIESGLDELEKAGYLVRQKQRSKSGKFQGSDWYVYDKKTKSNQVDDDSESSPGDNQSASSSNNNSNRDEKQGDNEVEKHAKAVIDMLNKKADKHYRYSKSSMKYIKARLHGGYSSRDFAYVIKNKAAQWKDGSMNKYLRPNTLFTDEHMNNYLNEKQVFTNSSSDGGDEASGDDAHDDVSQSDLDKADEDNLNAVLDEMNKQKL